VRGDAAAEPAAATAARGAAAEPVHERAPGDDDVPETPITGSTAGGLPKRRRREVSEELVARHARAAQSAPNEDTGPVRTPYETASRMGAFARGTRSGRAESADDEGTTQE
jgi:hypothetical protein